MDKDYIIDQLNQVAFDMSPEIPNPEQFIISLYDLGVIQLGTFQLKSGITSPIYMDLRKSFTFPQILKQIAELYWMKIESLDYDLVCGVPLTALVFAICLSISKMLPMIVCRKERKAYGNQNRIEGEYFAGQQCVIIEDLITSGMSIQETIEPLKEESLVVEDIVCLIDREQGGKERLEKKGYHVHPVLTISQILEVLLKREKISQEDFERVKEFIKQNRVVSC